MICVILEEFYFHSKFITFLLHFITVIITFLIIYLFLVYLKDENY